MGRGVIEVRKVEDHKFYEVRTELIDPKAMGVDDDCEPTEMISAYSKSGDYLGSPKTAAHLVAKFGIEHFEKTGKDHVTCSVGFSPRDNKWYGWSHRALYGFTIGSTCKKGDAHYVPDSFSEIGRSCHARKGDMCEARVYRKVVPIDPNRPEGPLEAVGVVRRIAVCSMENCIFEMGKGEWVAKTMEDAKQMAIDFARGVS